MLAKEKLKQLKQEIENKLMDQKIIDAIDYDLVLKKAVSPDMVPSDATVVLEIYDKKIYKVVKDQLPSYFLSTSRYDSTSARTVREYQQVFLVEDFNTHYEEIKNLSPALVQSKVQNKVTLNFVLAIAFIILFLGIIGGFVIISELDTAIGLAAMISTASFSAILFGIAKIIELLSNQQQ